MKIARGCFCYCRTLKLFSLKILDTGRLYVFNNNISSLNISTGGPLLTGFFETLKKQPCKHKTVLLEE